MAPGLTVNFCDLSVIHRPIRRQLKEAAKRVIDRSHFVLGNEVEHFEREFAAYCGLGHAIGVSNGLDAIHFILRGYGVGPGDEVIVPAHTFIATWLAVSCVGATPVPVDVNPETYNIDPERVGRKITARTKAVIGVHLYGLPFDVNGIKTVIGRRRIRIIEDAAQAHGGRYGGRRVGSLGDAGAFSFYPVKNLGALGDGGAITTQDDRLARRLRRFRNYGSEKKYIHSERGYNGRLDEIQAAFLRIKLSRLDDWNAQRRSIAMFYSERLKDLSWIEVPLESEKGSHVYHQYVVCLRRPRSPVKESLARAGVATMIHYPVPPHLSGAYRDLGYRAGDFPHAERIARTCLSLPIYPGLTARRQNAVVEALRAIGR